MITKIKRDIYANSFHYFVRALRVPDERPYFYTFRNFPMPVMLPNAGRSEDGLIGHSVMLKILNSSVARRAGKMKGISLRLIPRHLSRALYHIHS